MQASLVNLLRRDHSRLRQLLTGAQQAPTPFDQRRKFIAFADLLAAHHSAEECTLRLALANAEATVHASLTQLEMYHHLVDGFTAETLEHLAHWPADAAPAFALGWNLLKNGGEFEEELFVSLKAGGVTDKESVAFGQHYLHLVAVFSHRSES